MIRSVKHRRDCPHIEALLTIVLASVLTVSTGLASNAVTQSRRAVAHDSAVADGPGGGSGVQPERGRVIHFPSDRSVGQVHVQEEGAGRQLTYWFHWTGVDGPPWEYFCEAQGDVHLPAGKHLRLMVNAGAQSDLSWLATLRPNDLYSFSFAPTDNAVKPGDAQLKHVTHLTGLKELALDRTRVTDWGMRLVSNFTSLECLSPSAEVTERGMVHVAQLSSLKRLYFPSHTKVRGAGLQHVSRLTALEELYLGQGIGDGGLTYLRGLPRLEYLCIFGDRFSDAGMMHVKTIPSLRIFSVHEGLSRIGDAGLAHIAELPNLEILCLHGMRGITDTGIARLAKMRSLKKLNIGSSQISDHGLALLKQVKTLERLDLPQEQYGITDEGLAYLAELSNLKHLQVSRIHFADRAMNKEYYTDRGLAELTRLRQLEELHIGSIGVTDAGMDHLATLTNLKVLHMFGCEDVTDKGLAKLSALGSLQTLDISGSQLTIAGLAAINSMTGLTRVDIKDLDRGDAVLDLSGLINLENLSLTFRPRSRGAFGDADLVCLANLRKLRWLQIGPRDFTDRGMLYLAGLANMERLSLGGPGLTDEGLRRLLDLKKLDLLSIMGRFDTDRMGWTSGGHITDAGLLHLERFKRLGYLEIYSDHSFSEEAVRRLWQELPYLYRLILNGRVSGRPATMAVRTGPPTERRSRPR